MCIRGLFLFPGIIGITFFMLSFLGCVPDLGDSDAALFLEDIVTGGGPSRLKAMTPRPTRRTIRYTIDGRGRMADLYLSPQGARAGIVLIPGVVEAGKDDVRLIALANSLARSRFAVLVPEIAGLRRFHTRASDVRVMADAFRYLVAQPELAPQGRAGFGGFSYGGGIVLLASLEPDIRDKVHYLMGFGGYYDMTSVVTYFTTGYYRDERTGRPTYRRPHDYLKKVFTISNSVLLKSPADRERVRALLEKDIKDSDKEIAKLAPDARALYDLVINEDSQRVATLIERLSPGIRKELDGINPSRRDLSKIRAQVILLHGRGDTMIPYTESIAIAKVLPKDKVKLFLIEGYAHTDVKPKREDLPQLLSAMGLLMQQRVNNRVQ